MVHRGGRGHIGKVLPGRDEVDVGATETRLVGLVQPAATFARVFDVGGDGPGRDGHRQDGRRLGDCCCRQGFHETFAVVALGRHSDQH